MYTYSIICNVVCVYICVALSVICYVLHVCCCYLLSRVWLLVTPWTVAPQAPLSMGFSKTAGVGCHALLQGILPTQISRIAGDSLPSEPPASPRILDVLAYPFSRESSQPRNRTSVSCITGGFFTSWATKEAPSYVCMYVYICVYN